MFNTYLLSKEKTLIERQNLELKALRNIKANKGMK